MDLLRLMHKLVLIVTFTITMLSVTSSRPSLLERRALLHRRNLQTAADIEAWQELHVTDPCTTSGAADVLSSEPPSPHGIAQALANHVGFLQNDAKGLKRTYCQQRYLEEFCNEAAQLVDDYFRPGALEVAGSRAVVERAQESYSKLVFLHLQLGVIILREKGHVASRSLQNEFTQLQRRTTALRCFLKQFLLAHGHDVVTGEPHIPSPLPKTPEGIILSDLLTLEQLVHLLDALHRDFTQAHPPS